MSVSKRKGATFNNNIYHLHEPIENMVEFFVKYPEAREVWAAKQTTADKVARRKDFDKEAFINEKVQKVIYRSIAHSNFYCV